MNSTLFHIWTITALLLAWITVTVLNGYLLSGSVPWFLQVPAALVIGILYAPLLGLAECRIAEIRKTWKE